MAIMIADIFAKTFTMELESIQCKSDVTQRSDIELCIGLFPLGTLAPSSSFKEFRTNALAPNPAPSSSSSFQSPKP